MSGAAFLELATTIALAGQLIAMALTVIRLLLGPTLPDRILALDTLTTLGLGMIAVFVIRSGVLLYLAQEGRGIGLLNKLRAYELQATGLDTVEANLALGFPPDSREWGIGNQILADLGLTTIRILTNNPQKLTGLDGYGLTVTEQIPIEVEPTPENARYLAAKREKLGHTITKLHHQGARLDREAPRDDE